MVIKCPKCSKLFEAPNEKLGKKDVCEHCDHVFIIDDSVIYKESQAASVQPKAKLTEQKPKSKIVSVPRIILGVIFVLVVILGILHLNRSLKESGVGGILPAKTYPLVNKTFKIEASGYWYVQFSCKNGTKLTGTVKVPEKDVNVWLIKGNKDFEAFKSTKEFYYISTASSQKISSFNVNCMLKEGTYYFIIDNTYSLLTPKKPTIDLSLVY